MRKLAVLLLLLIPVASLAEDKPDPWKDVVNEKGEAIANPGMPVMAGGLTYLSWGYIRGSSNQALLHLEGNKASVVSKPDRSALTANFITEVCGVAVAGELLAEGLEGAQYWRIAGTKAEQFVGPDKKPFKIPTEFAGKRPTTVTGPSPCPYFTVRTDRSCALYRIDDLVITAVTLEGMDRPQFAWTGSELLVTGGKQWVLLGGKEPVVVKDPAGAAVTIRTVKELAYFGAYFYMLCGNAARSGIYRIEKGVATQLALPDATSLKHFYESGGKSYILAEPGKGGGLLHYELAGTELKAIAALDAGKDCYLNKIYHVAGATFLDCMQSSTGAQRLFRLLGGEVAEIKFDLPAPDDLTAVLEIAPGPNGGWLVNLSVNQQGELWLLDSGQTAVRLQKPKGATIFSYAVAAKTGFYANFEFGPGYTGKLLYYAS
jgi:hypothetical protein